MQHTVSLEKYFKNIDNALSSPECFDKTLNELAKIYRNSDKSLKLKVNIILNLFFLRTNDIEYLSILDSYKDIFIDSIIYYQINFFFFFYQGNQDIHKKLYEHIINKNLNIAYLNQDITHFGIKNLDFIDYIDINKISLKLAVMSLLENLTIKFDNEYERKLAHYTNLDVANKIIKNETNLRLNSIEYVNDPSEGKILYEFLNIDNPININTVCDKDDPYYRYELFEGEKVFHVADQEHIALACCFTLNHNSLNQFRLYGKTKGVECSGLSLVLNNTFFNDIYRTSQKFLEDFKNNEIDSESLDTFVQNILLNNNDKKKLVYRCAYCDPKTKYVYLAKRNEYSFYQELSQIKDFNEINKIYTKYLNEIREKEKNVKELLDIIEYLIKDLLIKYDNDAELKDEIYSLTKEIDLLFKHYSFQEEQECRIVEYINLDDDELQTDFSINKIYIDYPINVRKNLKNIYLGKNIEQYLTYFKKELSGEIGTKIKIKVCEAPFN